MLIPLGLGSAGPLNSVDTGSISDSRVTEQLRQEPDRGVETRQDMVDLKERQSEEAGQQAAVQREAIREEEERIAREREEAARQREQAQQEQEQIARERQQPSASQERLDQREEAARQQEKAADEKDQQLDQREENLEDRKEEAKETQEFAEQKAEEAQQDREEIARDQQAMINNQANVEQRPADGILGASILSPNGSLGRVVKLNPDNGQELKRSALNTVNVRTLTLSGDKIIAIAGEDRDNGAIRLIEINRDTLEMTKQGEDDISPQSLLWTDGSSLYAITSSGGNLYLARFNTDLVRQARSSITIHPYGGITFSDGYIITQRSDGSAVLLNSDDLSERR
jgi:hypothetical protein